jgi:hypothetical protein
MKVSISLKTTLIIQALLVVSLIPMDIFLGHIISNYILFVVNIYILLWGLSYLDLIKNKKNKDLKIK